MKRYMENNLTTFIIPTIGRDTLQRAIDSVKNLNRVEGQREEAWIVYHENYVPEQRIGAGAARQRMINMIENTDWVSMLDDDDTVTPDYVERLKEEIEAHPEADLIHFREYFINTGQILPTWPEVAWGNVGISFSVKIEVAKKIGFKTEPYEDFEFVKRVQKAGYNVYFSKYLVYKVRH
jgi:glycosyltransferase involved in cell wall biosynthesis